MKVPRGLKTLMLIGGALACMPISMAAKGKPPVPKTAFSSWMVYWDTLHGRQALSSYGADLEELDLFAYRFGTDDLLVPAGANMKDLQDAYVQMPGKRKPRLGMTLVNDTVANGMQLKDPACVHRVLSTPAARAAHIQQILTIAEAADSIDVDYERVAAEDAPAFGEFIQTLAPALHEKGKRLSVVVEPRVSDKSVEALLSPHPVAQAWKEISQAADRLTIMAYLYHYAGSAPGSIAPIDWVADVAAYGLLSVPPEKLVIALHLGGFDWTKGGIGKSIDYDKADALAAAYGTPIRLDPKTQSGYFTYIDGAGPHEVWIETAAGLKAKVKRLRSMGITHIALWRLGAGDPALWDHLNKS